MNLIKAMHYAQYKYCVDNLDFGQYSAFVSKCTVTGLLAVGIIFLLDLIGFKAAIFLHSYLQSFLFGFLPIYFLVNYFSVSDKELDVLEDDYLLKQGRLFLNIFTILPIAFLAVKVIIKW